MPKKVAVENTKKISGNAKKAASAAAKAEENQKKAAIVEDTEWSKGAKSSAKKDAENEKKAELARKKAEKEALLKEEMESLKAAKPSASKDKKKAAAAPAGPKRGIDAALAGSSGFEDDSNKALPALSVSGIDNALDALDLTHGADAGVDRHPERRKRAAYAAFEERRLPEAREENKGLRLGQIKELLRKEFEKSDENPMNQINKNISYNATPEEIKAQKEATKKATEAKLLSLSGGLGGSR
ncbi:DUF1014 domain-containing protein [Peziza echinospora]|nr:DUF1014 domain-containing protein [Peziza echinospora]